jgi:hypothetical protein
MCNPLHRLCGILAQRRFGQEGIGFVALSEENRIMKLRQFRAASQEVQEKLVKMRGVFLMERKSMGVSVLLFQLDGFYVEVFYNTATEMVSFVKSFEDMDGIEAYLERIDIREVMAIL